MDESWVVKDRWSMIVKRSVVSESSFLIARKMFKAKFAFSLASTPFGHDLFIDSNNLQSSFKKKESERFYGKMLDKK